MGGRGTRLLAPGTVTVKPQPLVTHLPYGGTKTQVKHQPFDK